MKQSKFDIHSFLKEKAKRRKKISITIEEEYLNELKDLAAYWKVPLSIIIEACINLGLLDPYINPKNKKEEAS